MLTPETLSRKPSRIFSSRLAITPDGNRRSTPIPHIEFIIVGEAVRFPWDADSVPLQSFAAVRSCKIDNRPERNNPGRINFFMSHVVVPLDVIDADRFVDSRLLIKIE